jgi:hypothetical protein
MELYVCERDIVKAHLAELGKVDCGKQWPPSAR